MNLPIAVGILDLLMWKNNVAADRWRIDVAGSTIGRFHNARPAARHHRESSSTKFCTHCARKLIPLVLLVKSRAAENGYAWARKVQLSKATQKLGCDSKDTKKFFKSRARTSQHKLLGRLGDSRLLFFFEHKEKDRIKI